MPLLWSLCYDILIWASDMIFLIWALIWFVWYDSVRFAMFCWIWYDDSIWYDMICSVLMPEFLFYSWRYHGRVIEAPMAWHFLWRCDWSTASPFDMIMIWDLLAIICMYTCHMSRCIYMICFVGGGVWMHPRYSVLCRVNVSVCLHFFTLELATPFWYLEVSPLRVLMIWRICDYMVGDLFEYLVRSARGFPMFLMSIRVSR